MARNLSTIRSKAFMAQSERCYYCGYQMWQSSPGSFAKRLGLSIRQALQLRCTAEHLHAKCDGGSDTKANIAAACWLCNSRRHRRKSPPSPEAYKAFISKRLEAGGWHSFAPRPGS